MSGVTNFTPFKSDLRSLDQVFYMVSFLDVEAPVISQRRYGGKTVNGIYYYAGATHQNCQAYGDRQSSNLWNESADTKTEPQPLAGMFNDLAGKYDSPISIREVLQRNKVDISWMDLVKSTRPALCRLKYIGEKSTTTTGSGWRFWITLKASEKLECFPRYELTPTEKRTRDFRILNENIFKERVDASERHRTSKSNF